MTCFNPSAAGADRIAWGARNNDVDMDGTRPVMPRSGNVSRECAEQTSSPAGSAHGDRPSSRGHNTHRWSGSPTDRLTGASYPRSTAYVNIDEVSDDL